MTLNRFLIHVGYNHYTGTVLLTKLQVNPKQEALICLPTKICSLQANNKESRIVRERQT